MKRKTTTRTTRQFIMIAAGLLLPIVPASHAATVTWNAGTLDSTDGLWSTATNWTGDTAPADGDALVFDETANQTNSNDILPATLSGIPSLTLNNAGWNITLGALTLGSGGITANGNATLGGTLTLGAAQSWSNSSGLLTVAGTVTNDANLLSIGGAGDTTISAAIGNIGNTGGLAKSGAGILTFSGTNTYSGGTTNSEGILNAGSGGALGAGAVVNNATLNLTNTAETTYTFGAVSGNGIINISLGSGVTSAIFVNPSWTSFAGTINMGVSQAAGSGKVRLTNKALPNTATVNITTNSTLYTGFQGAVTHNAALTLGGGDTGETGGQLRLGNNNDVWAGPITLTGSVTGAGDVTVGVDSGTATISGVIGESGGSQSFSKGGAGTLVLTNANNYTGGTTISGGTLHFAKTNTMSATGAVGVATGATLAVNAGGTDEFTDATTNTAGSIGGLLAGTGGQGAAVNYTGSVRLGIDTTNATGGSLTYSGVIANVGTSLGITKLGAGTLTLSNANTYTGNTTISNGVLDVSGIGAQIYNSLSPTELTHVVTINTGGTLVVSQFGLTTGAGASLGKLTVQPTGLVLNGGTVVIKDTASRGRAVTIGASGGTLEVNTTDYTMLYSATILNTYTANSTLTLTGTGSATMGKAITGTGVKLVKGGSGTWTLTPGATNDFTGGTTVNQGTLALAAGGAGPGVIRGTLTIDSDGIVNPLFSTTAWGLGYVAGVSVNTIHINGGQLLFTSTAGNGGTAASNINMTGGTIGGSGGNTFDWYFGNTTTPFLNTLASASTATISANINLRLNGNSNPLTFNVAEGAAATDLLVSGNITAIGGNAGGRIVKSSAGSMTMTGTSTYTGGTDVTDGTLTINGSLADATMNISSGATVNGTGALTFKIDGTTADQVVNGGTINITGLNVGVNATGSGLTETEYVLVDGGTITGTFAGLTGAPGYTLDYGTPNQVKLVSTGSPYAIWATGGVLFTDDTNGDGVKNGLAWILGADNPTVSALGKLPTVTTPTGFLQLNFTREYPYAPAKLYVEYGNNLVGWTKLLLPADPGTSTIGSDIEVTVTVGTPTRDTIQVKIPTSHASGGKLFARLSASEN